MEIDLSSFVQITKSHGITSMLLNDIVRVNEKSVSISANLAGRLLKDSETANSASASIQYSPEYKALRLIPDDGPSAYSFAKTNSGLAMMNNMPKSLRAVKLPRGDYRLAQGYEDVFVLDPLTEDMPEGKRLYIEDPDDVEVGDIVSWPYRVPGKSNKIHIATGEVQKLFVNEESGKRLQVYVLSKEWLDTFPGVKSRLITVLVSSVIIREKSNAN